MHADIKAKLTHAINTREATNEDIAFIHAANCMVVYKPLTSPAERQAQAQQAKERMSGFVSAEAH